MGNGGGGGDGGGGGNGGGGGGGKVFSTLTINSNSLKEAYLEEFQSTSIPYTRELFSS